MQIIAAIIICAVFVCLVLGALFVISLPLHIWAQCEAGRVSECMHEHLHDARMIE